MDSISANESNSIFTMKFITFSRFLLQIIYDEDSYQTSLFHERHLLTLN